MNTLSPAVMDVIRAAAPTIGGILGTAILPGIGTGVGAAAANVAVDALSRALGVEPKPEAINARIEKDLAVINANGSGALVKQADLNLALHRADDIAIAKINADLSIAQQKLDNENTADARERFAGKGDKAQVFTIISVIVMAAGVFGLVLSGYADVKDPLANVMVGIIIGHTSAWMGNVVNYYVGSSQSSKRNGDALRSELMKR